MFAVSGSECVVDIYVGIACKFLCKFFLALFQFFFSGVIGGVVFVDACGLPFLFRIEAEVFEKKNLSRLCLL